MQHFGIEKLCSVRAEGKNTPSEWKHCHSQPLDGLHFMFVTCNSYLKGTYVTGDVMCPVIKALVTFSDLLKV